MRHLVRTAKESLILHAVNRGFLLHILFIAQWTPQPLGQWSSGYFICKVQLDVQVIAFISELRAKEKSRWDAGRESLSLSLSRSFFVPSLPLYFFREHTRALLLILKGIGPFFARGINYAGIHASFLSWDVWVAVHRQKNYFLPVTRTAKNKNAKSEVGFRLAT